MNTRRLKPAATKNYQRLVTAKRWLKPAATKNYQRLVTAKHCLKPTATTSHLPSPYVHK